MNKRCFGTDGIRGPVGHSLINAEFVLKLGWALGSVLRERFAPGAVLIGKDTRVSGYMLESALESGLSAAGMDVRLLGPMPTPAVAYLTRTLRATAGVMISASHNPYTDNGIKFLMADGHKFSDALEAAIEARVQAPMVTVEPNQLGKAERVSGGPERYIEFCKSKLSAQSHLRGMKLVIDCANGATYHIAPDVFRELGADVIALHDQPDGFNINARCGSTSPEDLRLAVIEHGADAGLAFDGDGDRLCMVDANGVLLDGDDMLYIIAQALHGRSQLGGGVVGTQMSNLALEHALGASGIAFRRVSVGDRHVLAALQQAGWVLGAEPSGHVMHLESGPTSDGIVAGLMVLDAMCLGNCSLQSLHEGLKKIPQTLRNIPKPEGLVIEKNDEIQAVLAKTEARLGDAGRVVLRASGTEPVIRVMVECADQPLADEVIESLLSAIAHYRTE